MLFQSGTQLAKPSLRELDAADLVAPIVAMVNTKPTHQYLTVNSDSIQFYVGFCKKTHMTVYVLKNLPKLRIQRN